MTDEHAPLQPSDPAPKVDGAAGGTLVAAGWGVRQLVNALSGDGGIRFIAFCVLCSFTWVSTRAIDQYMTMESSLQAALIRSKEEGLEREKSDNARRERDMREWMSAELDKTRRTSSDESERQRQANVLSTAAQTAAFALEREKDRAMVFRLAGAKMPPGPPIEEEK